MKHTFDLHVTPNSLRTVSIMLKNNHACWIFSVGPITIEFLRSFARLIGKEWYTLARGLRLEHVRIQSIVQQNKRSSLESLVYDLLLTWLKRSYHLTDKVTNFYLRQNQKMQMILPYLNMCSSC